MQGGLFVSYCFVIDGRVVAGKGSNGGSGEGEGGGGGVLLMWIVEWRNESNFGELDNKTALKLHLPISLKMAHFFIYSL